MQASELRSLIDYVVSTYPPRLGTSASFKRLGADLASIVGREHAWSRSYVATAHADAFGEGKRAGVLFCHSLQSLASSIHNENVPALLEAARHTEVFTWFENDISGSFVMGRSILCAEAGCQVYLVPNVPWRKFCPQHSR